MKKALILLMAIFAMTQAQAQAQTVSMDLDAIQNYLKAIQANGNCELKAERFSTRLEGWDRMRIEIKNQSAGQSDVMILSDANSSGTKVTIEKGELAGQPVEVFTYKQTYLQSGLTNLNSWTTLQLYVAADKKLVGAVSRVESEHRGFFSVKTKIDSQFECEN